MNKVKLNMMTRFSLGIVLLMALTACQSTSFKELNRNDYFQTTGAMRFILPEAPQWMNFFSPGQCYRPSNSRSLNLSLLKKEFNLTLRQALNAQFYFNEELNLQIEKMSDPKNTTLGLREVELSFLKAVEKTRSTFDPIRLPDFSRIHLIWLEDWVMASADVNQKAKQVQKLKDFLQSPVHQDGVPVVVSFCTTQAELEKTYQETGAFSLGAEWTSVFNEESTQVPSFVFATSAFFKPVQKIIIYRQKKNKENNLPFILGTIDYR